MLVPLGPPRQSQDLVDLLLECHARIRHFLRLAEEVGGGAGHAAPAVVEACQRCERYFVQALPLHVADEEQSILPRLRGASPQVDRALDAMHTEHAAHEPLLAELLAAARQVRGGPEDTAARSRLRTAAARLAAGLEPHRRAEEEVIFPAVRGGLGPEVQARIVAELRARRSPGA